MTCTSIVHRCLVALALGATLATASAQNAAALRERHAQLAGNWGKSPFQRPLLLQSGSDAAAPSGDVFAVVNQPFAKVATTLQRGERWCEVMLLQFNVLQCRAEGPRLHVALGRKPDQPLEDAFKLVFDYQLRQSGKDHLDVEMSAAEGPLGTSRYRLALKAVPLDAQRSFLHMSYSYATGAMARVATDAYLSTSGRNKVGFSVVGQDEAGKPLLAGGMRGVAERNTMRYFLAIEAVLDSIDQPAEQRQRRWFAATERYPAQLREMPLDAYLALKRRG